MTESYAGFYGSNEVKISSFECEGLEPKLLDRRSWWIYRCWFNQSPQKKICAKEKLKGDLEFYGTGCASFYTCPIFSIELINPKSFWILIGSFCWAGSKKGQVLAPVSVCLIDKISDSRFLFFLEKRPDDQSFDLRRSVKIKNRWSQVILGTGQVGQDTHFEKGAVRVPSPLPPDIGLLLKIFSETERERGESRKKGRERHSCGLMNREERYLPRGWSSPSQRTKSSIRLFYHFPTASSDNSRQKKRKARATREEKSGALYWWKYGYMGLDHEASFWHTSKHVYVMTLCASLSHHLLSLDVILLVTRTAHTHAPTYRHTHIWNAI